MTKATEHLDLLGRGAEDKVTGRKGVVTSLCFDLYGCIQAIVTPKADSDGKIAESFWLDITRLDVNEEERVMPLPDFDAGYVANGEKGPAEKPLP